VEPGAIFGMGEVVSRTLGILGSGWESVHIVDGRLMVDILKMLVLPHEDNG